MSFSARRGKGAAPNSDTDTEREADEHSFGDKRSDVVDDTEATIGSQSDMDTDSDTDSDTDTDADVDIDTDSAIDEGIMESDTAEGQRDCRLLIDDMENGTGHICDWGGRIGVGYAFNSGCDDTLQVSEPTTPGVPILPVKIPGGRDESEWAMYARVEDPDCLGAGIGLDLAFDGGTYGLYDGSTFDGVTFWARGGPASAMRVRLSTAKTTKIEYGGKNKSVSILVTALGCLGSSPDIGEVISKSAVTGASAGSLFVFKGRYRAVLISYPTRLEKDTILNLNVT